MKSVILSVAAMCALNVLVAGQTSGPNYDLPRLHQVKEVTLSPAYSCRSSDEFKKGYEKHRSFSLGLCKATSWA